LRLFFSVLPCRHSQTRPGPGNERDRARGDNGTDVPGRASERVVERSAALPAAYTLTMGSPFTFATGVVSTTPLPSAMSGASFCTVKYGPLAFTASTSSYIFSGVASNGTRPSPYLS
jgi:hypothetical protein